MVALGGRRFLTSTASVSDMAREHTVRGGSCQTLAGKTFAKEVPLDKRRRAFFVLLFTSAPLPPLGRRTVSGPLGAVVQGHLAHKKHLPPRTLQ